MSERIGRVVAVYQAEFFADAQQLVGSFSVLIDQLASERKHIAQGQLAAIAHAMEAELALVEQFDEVGP